MKPSKLIFLLIVIGLVAVFTFQNTQAVQVTVYFWSISMSVSLLLLSTFAAGILLGMLLTFVNSAMRTKHKRETDPQTTSSHGKVS